MYIFGLGRTGPGVCYRLYSEDEFDAMAEYSTPELQKVPLDALLLQMVAMGLPNARLFPFIEPPQSENIENAIESLKQHVRLKCLRFYVQNWKIPLLFVHYDGFTQLSSQGIIFFCHHIKITYII